VKIHRGKITVGTITTLLERLQHSPTVSNVDYLEVSQYLITNLHASDKSVVAYDRERLCEAVSGKVEHIYRLRARTEINVLIRDNRDGTSTIVIIQ